MPLTELLNTPDQYKTIYTSTSHLPEVDADKLSYYSTLEFSSLTPAGGLVWNRENGYIVKLYHDFESTLQAFSDMSDAFKYILDEASRAGFHAIEFDADATVYTCFPTFDW